MEKLIEILQNPFKGLTNKDVNGIQDRCLDITKDLFENYCIKCDNQTFRFAEIEFYYYKKEESSNNNFDADWNKETYPRNKNAGDFFFHYSGIDICFKCHFEEKEKDNEYGEFGGILIRSLCDENQIIAGPLFCANTIMNACKKNMPILERSDYHECILEKTLRCGISSDERQEKGKELNLCYYVTHVDNVELKWDKASERIAWDKKKGIFKNQTRNYKRERFNEDH